MKHILLAFTLVVLSGYAKTQSQITIGTTTLQVDTLASGLDIPWEILWGPDDYIWMTERRGRVSRVNPENGQVTVILNHQSAVWQNSESGMLGMALHPDFENSPYVYIAYTYGTSSSNAKEKIVRFEYNGTNLVQETTLLDNIPANSTHIGCRILFMPDGTLLFTTGDAQNQPSSQDLGALSGKVLRMNPDGSIPADNPYGPDSYVYANGLRNTQGMVLLDNGRIFLSEHGPNTDDEFMELLPGRNYGWPNVHGFCTSTSEIQFCADSNVVEPLIAWTPTIAPSDLIFYENPFFPEWDGKFLMTVLKDRMLVAIEMNEDMDDVVTQTQYLNNMYGRLRDICVGPNKEIYLATNGQFWSNTQPNTHTIVRLRPISSGVGLNGEYLTKLVLYPNPSKGTFKITASNGTSVFNQVVVRDLSGRVVANFENVAANSEILFGNTPAGVYFVEVETDGVVILERLVIQ
jgi:glucose/arabinose dehydrogenase